MKKPGCKIAVIGGGSSYTPELIEGLIKRYHEVPVSELWLVDIEQGREKLEVIAGLARRMIAKAELEIAVLPTLNREQALDNADFVLTQFRVGQLEARILDETIPAKHGIIGQETNGAGGLFKGLRTIPVIFDIIAQCQRLCPDAWIISFTNPVGIITEAVFRHTEWKQFIGLCNVPIDMEMTIARILGVDSSRLRVDFAGLNHQVFALDVRLDGASVLDDVLRRLGQPDAGMTMSNVADVPWTYDFLKGLGAIPCAYHRYYWLKDQMLQHILDDYSKGVSRGQLVRAIEADLFAKYADPRLAEKPPELEQRGGAYYSDAACSLIASLYTDKGDIQVVNSLNNGSLSCLPDDVVVEASYIITKNGPRPLASRQLPPPCQGLIQQMKAWEIQAAKAAVTGCYHDALVAMATNPLVQSVGIGTQVLNELLLAHKEHLPQFAEAIKMLEENNAPDSQRR